MAESCKTCRFSRETSDQTVICRRYPPVMYLSRLAEAHDDHYAEHVSHQPLSSVSDWCGEYQERKS